MAEGPGRATAADRRLAIVVAGVLLTLIVVAVAVSGRGKAPNAPAARPVVTPTPTPTVYRCVGDPVLVFDNWNGGAVVNGGSPPTFNTNGRTYCLASIATLHWNARNGKVPGTIGLVTSTGPAGPWPAIGTAGDGGAANVNWIALATGPTVIISGSFTCIDSDPATWSNDRASDGDGFCRVWVTTAVPE